VLITRKDLARRWHTSTRTIDRQRERGLIPWIDLSQGKGLRPCVRFRLADIEALELHLCGQGQSVEAQRETV
jgi:hypothetical protein